MNNNEPIPDIVAHCHTCPICDKEHYCTITSCESLQFRLCEECGIDMAEVC